MMDRLGGLQLVISVLVVYYAEVTRCVVEE
jgi:hypothetical protein